VYDGHDMALDSVVFRASTKGRKTLKLRDSCKETITQLDL